MVAEVHNPNGLKVGDHATAYGLKGFGKNRQHLRVTVDRLEGRYVWVTTADRKDTGTPLVLDTEQVYAEPAW